MTKPFEVTDAMVETGITAANYRCRCGEDFDDYYAKLLIAAAIDASGLVEENERLRSNIEGLSKIIRDSIKENDGPDRVWIDGIAYEGPLADNYFKAMRLILTTFDLILNKEHP
jgi:hypothetical protein